MEVAFTRISWWLWGATNEGEPSNSGDPPAPLSSSFDFGLGFREPMETLRLSNSKGSRVSSSRKAGKRKWRSREHRRVDREYDMVVVPSDGGCLSGTESEDSDWSIGWLEPHAPDFQSDGQGEAQGEGSFAVLVPCYGRGRAERPHERGVGNHVLGAIDLSDSSDGRKYMEEILSNLQSAS